MNYLAHAWLSFNDEGILMGNMLSDFVKGRQRYTYSEEVQKGITLHRAIDEFTDEHVLTASAKQVFRPSLGLYAGAFTDIVYDHFLALDASENSEEGWRSFTDGTYSALKRYAEAHPVPERFARMLHYMKAENWLFNYRHRWCIENSFRGMTYRAKFLEESNAIAAYAAFENNYEHLQQCYQEFFPLLKAFAWEQYLYLCKN